MLVVAPTAPAGTTIVTPSTTNWVTVLLSPGSLSVSLVRTLPLTGVSSGVLAVSGLATGAALVTTTLIVAVSLTPPLLTV
jgi:hypothetical protein